MELSYIGEGNWKLYFPPCAHMHVGRTQTLRMGLTRGNGCGGLPWKPILMWCWWELCGWANIFRAAANGAVNNLYLVSVARAATDSDMLNNGWHSTSVINPRRPMTQAGQGILLQPLHIRQVNPPEPCLCVCIFLFCPRMESFTN